jgi:hypothetical protein
MMIVAIGCLLGPTSENCLVARVEAAEAAGPAPDGSESVEPPADRYNLAYR